MMTPLDRQRCAPVRPFVLVLPQSATDAELAHAARLYPYAEVSRSRQIPLTVTKGRR